ncbi:outer membrane lipoprotein-sorting protein [Desulfobacterales bacterium HSG16]|nr:outer membrane lipoprotein-sorting protein [Desulfobacterales bacterium HSG16]
MNKKNVFITILSLAIAGSIIVSTATADDIEARKVMEKVDARDDGDHVVSELEMILTNKRGKKRIRRIKGFSKDYGENIYRLMFFLAPADVKNTAFMTYDYDGEKDDDQWLYLPALRKTKRIASDDRTSSFMGSDFSYADMTKPELVNYDYKLLKETEVHGHRAWVIESVPKTKKVVDDFGYTRSLFFVRQDNYVPVRAIHWAKDGGKLKYMDVIKLEKIDNIWTSLEISMTTKKGKVTKHKTLLRYHDVKYNQNLGDEMFSVRIMEKGL